MTISTQLSERPAIEYPDSDGEPMAENTLQFKWIVTIKEGLEAMFVHEPDVFVAGDLLWYPVKGDNKIRRAPDAMVAFSRPKGYRGSYKQWEEGNQAPQVVFEVLSPGNGPVELAEKFQFYERYGVEEYYIYDPDDGSLEGWRRTGEHLERIPRMAGFVSPRLRIRFEPGPGSDNLAIFGPDGTQFLSFTEWVEKSKAEERRAEEQTLLAGAERQRAEAADQRAVAADQRAVTADQRAVTADQRAAAAAERAERLAARLRELGIEPE